MNYYPFHVGDFAAHTAHLTWEEDIAYRRMLDIYYLHERALPSDAKKVARLIRMPASQPAVDAVLEEFFVLSGDGWHNKRADAELTAMLAKQEQQSSKDAHEADRMRRYRDRRSEMFSALREVQVVPAWDVPMKELQRLFDVHCNGPATDLQREQVTNCNATATAIPTPIPTPTPIPEQKTTPSAAPTASTTRAKTTRSQAEPVPDPPESIDLAAWSGFVEMRKRERHPLTKRAAELIFAELEKLRRKGHDPTAVLDQSTRKGWRDVFALKPDTGATHATHPPRRESLAERVERRCREADERDARAADSRAESAGHAHVLGANGRDLRA